MKIFDNKTSIVRDDLIKTISNGDKISITASYFSIYAFEALKDQLTNCDEIRFIFSSPTFVKESTQKAKREFFIPKLEREKNLYGTEFEVRLRNELTQKKIAKECSEWIKKKVSFKSNTSNAMMSNYITVESNEKQYAYTPLNAFSTVDLGCEEGNNLTNFVTKIEYPESLQLIDTFNKLWKNEENLVDVTNEVVDMISNVYEDNSPELIYFMTLYNIFSEFLEDISEDVLPNEATGFKQSVIWNKLYDFQRDAVLAIINKLEQYNGCILADSVGLGKTFTALSVIKYYEGRNKNVLVLCPKKLAENWMTYRGNLINNPLSEDKLRYDVLYHTDLSRESGMSGIGLAIDRINWSNYDLVVIDESHNFRNGPGTDSKDSGKLNRYTQLVERIIKPGVKTKVLMLSATPVNNRFSDLKNQLALAYGSDSSDFSKSLNLKNDIDNIFSQAQRVYNIWAKADEEYRTTENLLSKLDYDFFNILDQVTIARSRKHIQSFYDIAEIGQFPKRLKPISLRPKLTETTDKVSYQAIFSILGQLNLAIYTPSSYILPSQLKKYLAAGDIENMQRGREIGIQKLMSINLLKRMESSVYSFMLTLNRILAYYNDISNKIELFMDGMKSDLNLLSDLIDLSSEFDDDDQNTDFFTVGKKIQINLLDMDYITWKSEIDKDINLLNRLLDLVMVITPETDNKLLSLMDIIRDKIENPINKSNHKIIIFTAFADTAEYLYEHVTKILGTELNLNVALVTGSVDGKTNIPNFKSDMNHVLACFSPKSKEYELIYKDENQNIDILIATDCISEGQNLQDCDYCINYDIHWNPVRIIQRFGRIDRIGSTNDVIQLVNFWPDIALDEYINLKSRVETRMKISVMTSTGDDDPININEDGDLLYRKSQLERLQNEVLDIEEMNTGISIMDLGLNDFRIDLLQYMKEHSNIERLPKGINAVVQGENPGIIFILKNINANVNIDKQNRLHPFYLVYISDTGEVISDHLHPKETLDLLRYLSKGKSSVDIKLSQLFNKMTNDGKDMEKSSYLLQKTIQSIINVKKQGDVDSFFKSGITTLKDTFIDGLDDFELICFMVVMR